MRLKGIDVSDHQGKIDWERVKNDGIDFAMIRMGFGGNQSNQDDDQFERNVKECERLNIPWGAYLYSYAMDSEDVESEIQHARRLLKGKNPLFPVSYDMEDADNYKKRKGMPKGEQLVDFCYRWLDAMEQDGHYVSLYANRSWLNGRLKHDKLNRFDKWLAEWADNPTYKGTFTMWQYTSNGKVDGINGDVDLNLAYTNYRFNHVKPETKEETGTYTVMLGDNLTKISKKYRTTVQRILELNPDIVNQNMIYVNQVLQVPRRERSDWRWYEVSKGDTLSGIANRFDTTVRKLMEMNTQIKDKNVIYLKQKIKVPKT